MAGEPGLILDLACGSGRFWPVLAEHVNRVILASDNSQAMLDHARVPIEGDINNPKASIVETLATVLQNAFVRALAPNVEGKIDVESAKPNKGSKPIPTRDTTKNQKSDQERVREKQEEKK